MSQTTFKLKLKETTKKVLVEHTFHKHFSYFTTMYQFLKKSFKNDFQTELLQKYLLFDSQSIDRIMKSRWCLWARWVQMSPCIQQMGRSTQIGQPEGWRILIGFWFLYNSWVIREWTWRFGCHDQGEIDPIGSFLRAAAVEMEETCSNRNYVIFSPSLIFVTFIAL